jgi:hypothetical protein
MSLKVYAKRLGTSVQTIYTAPLDVESSAHAISFSNVTLTPATFSLRHYHARTQTLHLLAINYSVPANTVYRWPSPINMFPGDYIDAYSAEDDAITCQISAYENPTTRAGLNVRGLWDSTFTYYANDIVEWNNSSYIAITENVNIIPGGVDSGSFWQVFGSNTLEQQATYVGPSPPIDPYDGRLWWNSAKGKLEIYYNDGSSSQWVDASPVSLGPSINHYDLVTWQPGKMGANQILLKIRLPRGVAYESNFAGSSIAEAETAPTDTAVCTIYRNSDVIGTVTYEAGSTVGVIASTGGDAFTCVTGDVIKITAPSPRDLTFEGVSIVLVGSKTG